jgi:hypothetical protein
MPAFRSVVSVLVSFPIPLEGTQPHHRRENFLYTLKAGPAGGRLRRPSSAGSDTTVTEAPASLFRRAWT